MRIFKTLIVFLFLSVFASANDKNENIKVLNNLYEKVILKDINKTLSSLEVIKTAVEKQNIQESKKGFRQLVKSWKSVETFYILGDLNEDFIDIPRLIDIYHNGNEDIKKQLDRAIKSKDELRIALFKNSLKSINALEYILYSKDIKKQRVNDIALVIVKRITSHIKDIKAEYLAQKKNFIENLQKANSIIINAIIQNSYKLKEWRIGDVIGLSKKYEGSFDNRRAEYYISKNSALAIEAILHTYENILDNPKYYEFGDYLVKLTDGVQMKELRTSLKKSIKLVKEIKNDDFKKAQTLFDEINKIHVILFIEMVEDLSINAKILDADGD